MHGGVRGRRLITASYSMCARRRTFLTGASRGPPGSGKDIAEGKVDVVRVDINEQVTGRMSIAKAFTILVFDIEKDSTTDIQLSRWGIFFAYCALRAFILHLFKYIASSASLKVLCGFSTSSDIPNAKLQPFF